MQNTVTKLLAGVLVFNMGLNIAMGVMFVQQRNQLRAAQAAAAQAAAQASTISTQAAPPAASGDQADLKQQLERSEKDRIKASRDAANMRTQVEELKAAAKERDTLKTQVQQLQQKNGELLNQVGNLQSMNTINGQVVALRELQPLRGVPRQFMNHTELRSYFTDQLNKELSPQEEQRQLGALRALGMDNGATSLREGQVDQYVNNVLGFYNQETKQLVVITDRPKMGIGDQITYAHEFTHNLQDQHFNLTALFAQAAGNSDHQNAIRGLVEGDATLTMGMYARDYLSSMDIVKYQLELYKNLDVSRYFSGGGGPQVESAMEFPYTDGAQFVAELYQTGGWALVNRAFSNPPRSTEQVLHPEKYMRGEQPLPVGLPNLQAALPGWSVLDEDTLGELYMRIYLEFQVDFATAIPAAEGWGGDRYQALSDGKGGLALALRSVWDSPADAREFFMAYGAYVASEGKGAPAQQLGPGRMRWKLPKQEVYLSVNGNQALVLRAPDAATLDRLIAQFPGL